MADMQDLARLLSSAHAPGPQMSHAAEQLFQCESHVGFGIVLLQLVQTESMDLGIRQAGSIYFKNYLKRRWGPDRGIPDNEKEVIKESLLPLTLRVPRLLRAQFLGALQEMAGPEFLSDWPQLLSELSRLLASAQDDVLLQAVAMDARTRSSAATEFLARAATLYGRREVVRRRSGRHTCRFGKQRANELYPEPFLWSNSLVIGSC